MFSYDPRKIDFQCFHYLFSFFQFCTLDALAPGLLQIILDKNRKPLTFSPLDKVRAPLWRHALFIIDYLSINYLLHYIGNQMKTAQSQRAWEMMMAPRRSGKKRYARPQMKPATAAAMMSMKLNFDTCTRL